MQNKPNDSPSALTLMPNPSSALQPANSRLELLLWHSDSVVLWDTEQNHVIARNVESTSESSIVISSSQCPLCHQAVSASDASFLAERYFRLLETIRPPSPTRTHDQTTNPFMLGDEVADVRELSASLLNSGYYERFFREVKCLGRGSYGAVFLCNHVIDEINLGSFAVKKVPVGHNREWFRKIVREVKALERLASHPNIVSYRHSWLDIHRHSEFCPYTPFLFILMTYCDRGNLQDLVSSNIPEQQIWSIFIDIIHGLSHLHKVGILHRDLKPSNILILTDDEKPGGIRAVLSDFGTAEIVGELTGVSHTGFTGTVEFTAPEVLASPNSGYSEQADMWSVGIVMYVLSFGSVPYSDPDPQVCASMVMSHEELNLPEVPIRSQELLDLIAALTCKEWKQRPLSSDLLGHPFIREQIRSIIDLQNTRV